MMLLRRRRKFISFWNHGTPLTNHRPIKSAQILFASRQRSGWHLVAKMCTALCSIAAWKWPAEIRVSWIAPEQLGRSGRETAHSMRRSDGTTMAAVTWRHVPRGTCNMPPREPFEKCCVRAAAQTRSGREPKLSGQKHLGLNCVSLEESASRGQNCAPRGQFYCFQPSAL